MAGYAKRVIKLEFPDLTEDFDNDPIWVSIRNPRLVPSHELAPDQDTPIVDGMPASPAAAVTSMHRILAKLVIGWRVYDATQPVELDAAGNDVTVSQLLPHGPDDFSAENCAKLPSAITNRIAAEMTASVPH